MSAPSVTYAIVFREDGRHYVHEARVDHPASGVVVDLALGELADTQAVVRVERQVRDGHGRGTIADVTPEILARVARFCGDARTRRPLPENVRAAFAAYGVAVPALAATDGATNAERAAMAEDPASDDAI